jgi:lipopolysaccharide export system permease protein
LRILQRYFFREMSVNFIGVTLVLFAILFVNQIGSVLARAAQLQYPRGVVLELIGLGIVQNVALLFPVGLLLGVVLAFGRLWHDSEMAAAFACGASNLRLYAPVWLLALPVAGALAWLNFDLAPRAAVAESALRSEALRLARTAPVEAGKFHSFDDGRTVVYARAADAGGQLHDVFIKHDRGNVLETAVAQRAQYSVSHDGLSQTVILFDGERLDGVPGSNRYRVLRFEQMIIPLTTPGSTASGPRLSELSTEQLLARGDNEALGEFHWRLGLPVMALVLAALAIPISRLRPRQGRYARVWQAVLVFALYANLATAARAWIDHGYLPTALGLWWVHGLFAMLAVLAVYLPYLRRRSRGQA